MAEQTRRELLEAAWSKADEEEEVTVVEEPENEELPDSDGAATGSEPGIEEEGEDEQSDDKHGLRPPKKEKEERKKPKEDETQQKEVEAAGRDDDQREPTKTERPTDRAPQSWKPTARESWGKIPAEARAEISRRELEIQRTLSQTDSVRRFANDFAQVINPFIPYIRAQNATPLGAVKNLMTTAAGLIQGNAQQKAAIVAEICQNYGVDLQVLDGYLADNWDVRSNGLKGARGGQRMEAPPSWAAPLFGFMENIEQQRQAHQQKVQLEADEKIKAAESKPFFDDLRDDIADIMDIAANRGQQMTIDQAYEKALKLNDEINRIVTQRKKAEEAKKNGKVIGRARRAASTISGSPSGKVVGSKTGEKMTRREMLREAWDNAE